MRNTPTIPRPALLTDEELDARLAACHAATRAAVNKIAPKLAKATGFVYFGRLAMHIKPEHKPYLPDVLMEMDGVTWSPHDVSPSRVYLEGK